MVCFSPRSSSLVDTGIAALILLIAATVAISSAAQDSQTYDEGVHLASGYSYWKTGDFRLSPEHPPLSKLIVSLPLLWLQPDFSPEPADWQRADPWPISRAFLYSNRISADSMIMAARIVVVLMYLTLAASLAWWVREQAGRAAGLAALLMLAFEPTVMAHGRYVTTDLPAALFIWLAWISWCSYLRLPTRWRLVVTAVLTGMAFATKFNSLFLPIAFALTWTRVTNVRWWKIPAITVMAFVIALGSYGFDATSVAGDPTLFTRSIDAPSDGVIRQLVNLPVPGYYFIRGIHMLIRDQLGGYPAYFMGEISSHGSWKYFPVALLTKSSLAWLAMVLLAGGLAVLQRSNHHGRLLLIPVVAYLILALTSSFNIGIRHLLPIYPFLCAFTAVTLFNPQRHKKLRMFSSVLVVLLLAESAAAYPHYLAFFNLAAGGRTNGHRYIADSNLDWGQDLKRLNRYIKANQIDRICLSYFGTADPAYYGIVYDVLPPLRTMEDVAQVDCLAAVSAQHLYATRGLPFEALYQMEPSATVGSSIYLYDLRRVSAVR